MLSTQLTQALLSFTLWFWTLLTLVSYSHDLNVGTPFSCWIQSRNLALESLMELQVGQLSALSLFLDEDFQRSHYLLLALFCDQPHPVSKLGQICFLEKQGLCWQRLQLFEVNAWSLQKAHLFQAKHPYPYKLVCSLAPLGYIRSTDVFCLVCGVWNILGQLPTFTNQGSSSKSLAVQYLSKTLRSCSHIFSFGLNINSPLAQSQTLQDIVYSGPFNCPVTYFSGC